MRRRTIAWTTGCVALVVAAGAGTAALTDRQPDDPDDGPRRTPTSTAAVERGDLQGTTPLGGKLSRADGPTVGAGVDGTVTALPGVGDPLTARSVLARIDELPVVAFDGTVPQYRAFEPGMTDGADVGQVETNLDAWGYLTGAPDDHFDWRTTAAIRTWQRAVGLPRTGTIEMGRIEFVTGAFRPSTLSAVVGDRVAADQPLYATKRDDTTISVQLPVGSPLARQDAPVRVRLPGRAVAPGRIADIGAAKATDDGKTVVPIAIALDDPGAAGDLTDASVTVDFVSEERTDVLSVPVTALGAAAGDGFIVEVPEDGGSSKEVPVEVGLFAGDRVEVTGGRLRAGQKVLVPAG